jgi:RND superfamily putative drug exporter
MLGRTGRACYRHRWLTLAAWIVGTACLITLWMQFGAAANNNLAGNDTGQTVLNQHFPRQSGDTLTLAIRSTEPITSAGVKTRVTGALGPFRRTAHVTAVSDPYTTPGQISRNGHIAFASVQFSVTQTGIPSSEASALMNDARAASGHGVTFSLGGDVVDQAETPYGGSSDGIGIGAAAIVLLIAFGSLLAMGLPIVTAVFGIGCGLALIALLGHIFPAPSFSPIVASMIGLGVGVDYALFIVTRFREALREMPPGQHSYGETLVTGPATRASGPVSGRCVGDVPPRGRGAHAGGSGGSSPRASTAEDATVQAMRTAGRSVLVAGTTVVIGMMGLLVLRESLMNGVAVAAAATVAMTVLGSLTLLPALLGFTGTRLARPSRIRLPGRKSRGAASGATDVRSAESSSPWAERWAAVISRHPVVSAVLATVTILILAVPVLSMKLSFPDESAQASGTMGRASYLTMADGFGPGFDAPLIVAATLPGSGDTAVNSTATARLARSIGGTPGIARVTPPITSPDGKAVMLVAYPATGEQDPATDTLVNRINNTVLPRATAGTGLHAYLTGPNVGNVAFANMVGQRLPWLIAVVIVLSMLLLTVVFRSVVIAVKAAVMNLLSITAAYGVGVGGSQGGWGHQLFGFPEKVPVTTWVPMFLFVILFGLSMDYEVFLLSRIREEYDRTGDNTAAVARGLARTARVITAAATIMVVVFLSFVLGADVSVKQIGLGLAVAVLVDATIVRLVLVPAVMELLGRANWWLPRPLARILPAPAPEPADDAPVVPVSEPLVTGH